VSYILSQSEAPNSIEPLLALTQVRRISESATAPDNDLSAGIDYTHPALGGGFGPGFKVVGGFDLVGDDYDGTPVL
jgi:hypothetical protein